MKKQKNVILAWLKGYRKLFEKKENMLNRLMNTPSDRDIFLDLITSNLRQTKEVYRYITGAFPNTSRKNNWYEVYLKHYVSHMNGIFKKAKTIEDILRFLPNLSPWTLEQRFGTIKIGSVPDIFGTETKFLSFVGQINKSQAVKNFKKIKKLECSLPDFEAAFPAVKKIDWFNISDRSDFLKNLMQVKCGKAFTIKQDGKSFKVTFLCNPFSSKMVFQIQTPNKTTYILKAAPYRFLNTRNDRVRKEHENMAIRADSTYSDALLEFYLKLNACPHAPAILYYHFAHEVALYEAESGSPFHSGKNTKKYMDFYSFNSKVIPDAVRLGIYVNDINTGNFLVSDKDGQVKIIDIGHATYANPLMPGVPGLTFTLGNLCGRDYISLNGVLDVEDV